MNPFYGKRVVLTGLFVSGFRKELRAKLNNLGAEVTNVVDKKVDLLIYGDNAGRRLEEARHLGIQTMTEEEFLLAYTKLSVRTVSDHRLRDYSQMPSNPGGAIFMYEVRQMARELELLREFMQQVPLKLTEDGSYVLDTDRAFVAPSDKALPTEIMIHGLLYRQEPLMSPAPKESVPTWTRPRKLTNEILEEYLSTTDLSAVNPTSNGANDEAGIYVSKAEPFKISNCTVDNGDHSDAERWRALLASPAIRILGASNVKEPTDNGYAHFGMEIWSVHSSRLSGSESTEYGRDILTKYADIMRGNLPKTERIDVGITDNDNPTFNPIRFTFQGKNTSMELSFMEGDAILSAKGDEQKAMLLSSAKERGITENVELVVTRSANRQLAVFTEPELSTLSLEFEEYLRTSNDQYRSVFVTDVYREDNGLYFKVQTHMKDQRPGPFTCTVKPLQTCVVKAIFSPVTAVMLSEKLGFTL